MNFVYMSSLNGFDFTYKIQEIYTLLSDLDKFYPDFKKWFDSKVKFNLNGQEREIITLENEETNEIMGLVILKNTEHEKKICTLKVFEKYRGFGLGDELVNESIKFLGTDRPFITIPEERHQEFQNIITKYNFIEGQTAIKGLYRVGKREFIYNGVQEPLTETIVYDKKNNSVNKNISL